MDMEHSSYETASTQQRGNTLESNAERFAKVAARKGIHVADPAGTMRKMFETFVGKRLGDGPEKASAAREQRGDSSQQQPRSEKQTKDTKPKKARQTKGEVESSSSSSSSSSTSGCKTKPHKKRKRKKIKETKAKRTKKERELPKGKKCSNSAADKLAREKKREEADQLKAMDPKHAAIIKRFRKTCARVPSQ
ncbi:unnamed protein product [Prorocentrum cordatum]|uniref:ADP-ribosylation factor-like protein 6-interacting protein 4 n=1 Tax=Prorocentrum cordatum TaxID=2364126 RepID=A0ABN9W1S9_9DINO|nr:unnamed protein product [Polarella glacialis]|mmetsp:Transcript_111390/g.315999  ORF Transcript_111390/g.315999 Transcript_111390/m.315999 type:complete len:193 (-) Transcript_111390:297-875(-)